MRTRILSCENLDQNLSHLFVQEKWHHPRTSPNFDAPLVQVLQEIFGEFLGSLSEREQTVTRDLFKENQRPQEGHFGQRWVHLDWRALQENQDQTHSREIHHKWGKIIINFWGGIYWDLHSVRRLQERLHSSHLEGLCLGEAEGQKSKDLFVHWAAAH